MLALVRNSGYIIRMDVERLLGVSASTASRLLRRMVEKNILTQHGKGRRVKYILPK